MSKPPLFFIVIIGLIIVAASFRFMQQRREKADNDMAPLQQKLVVVSNKREKPINDRRSRQQEVTPAGTSMRYEASFKPQSGGMEQTFRLDAQQYHALTVGDKGTLSYKGVDFNSASCIPCISTVKISATLTKIFSGRGKGCTRLRIKNPQTQSINKRPILISITFSLCFALIQPISHLTRHFFPM